MTPNGSTKYGFSSTADPENNLYNLNSKNANAVLIVWLLLVTDFELLREADKTVEVGGDVSGIGLKISTVSDATHLTEDTILKILNVYHKPQVPDGMDYDSAQVRQSFQTVAKEFVRFAKCWNNGGYHGDQYLPTVMQICADGAKVDLDATNK